jgi:ribosomal protein S15P/S13E
MRKPIGITVPYREVGWQEKETKMATLEKQVKLLTARVAALEKQLKEKKDVS